MCVLAARHIYALFFLTRPNPGILFVCLFFVRCQINRCKGGICWEELKDTYSTVAGDMRVLQETGSVIAVKNKETNKYENLHCW